MSLLKVSNYLLRPGMLIQLQVLIIVQTKMSYINLYQYDNYAGGGTPNDRSEQRVGTTPLNAGSLPSSSVAKQEYEAQGG